MGRRRPAARGAGTGPARAREAQQRAAGVKVRVTVQVRRYRDEDAPALEPMARAGHGPTPREVIDSGGQAWTVHSDGRRLGYATLTPLPGLEGVLELHGYVIPGARRQGVGSHLLRHVLQELSRSDVRRVTHQVSSLQDAEARFLRRHGFYLEHEEWEMALALPGPHAGEAPASHLSEDVSESVRLQTLPASRAVDLFRRLYDDSFGGKPWYQPYSRREVASELLPGSAAPGTVRDILFLLHGEEAVGFAAVTVSGEEGEIEPMGIVRQKQGRGLGWALLLFTLRWFGEKDVARVRLGVWRSNRRAVALYRRAGFQRVERRFFLAYSLPA